MKRNRYSTEVAKIIDERIPEEVREALLPFGWNALGVYEAVREVIKEAKKKGHPIKHKII